MRHNIIVFFKERRVKQRKWKDKVVMWSFSQEMCLSSEHGIKLLNPSGLWSKYYWGIWYLDENIIHWWFKLLYSQASTQLQIWVFTGRVLTNDCSHRYSSPELTCVHSHYRSRLDQLLAKRPRNWQQTIRRTVIRSNRGGMSTAPKSNVKQRDKKGFTLW